MKILFGDRGICKKGQGYLQKGTGVFSKRDGGMYTYENGVVGSVGGMV